MPRRHMVAGPFLVGAIGTKSASVWFRVRERNLMPDQTKERPPPKADHKKPPVHPRDKESSSPEPEHVDPPPRDVREAPSPNPNGNKNG